MINYVYPTSRVLRQINPEKIANLQRNRPTFALFPVRDYQEWRLEWQQRDNYRGFQQLRGLNGEPSYVKMVGLKRYSQEPGVFGEYMTIDEAQMTTRAALYANGITDRGVAGGAVDTTIGLGPVNITDLVAERQEYLNARETDVLEYMHWAILLNGTFTILGPTGAEFKATFPVQTASLSDWSDHANSTPYADLIGIRLLARGKSISFSGAQAFANAVTVNHALSNTNPNDLGGMRAGFAGLVRTAIAISLEEANRIFQTGGGPTLVEYDEMYNRESDGALVPWIPDDVVSVVGRRTNGDTLGEHRMVRNVNNPANAAGRYTKVIDNLDRDVPRKISVHQGHNGGLVLFYPSAILRVNV